MATKRTQVRRRLPSTASLQAFEAVARRLSFTRAALELNLTQTAVSHQVRKLETALGMKLFVRDKTGIRLTEVGRSYLESVRMAMTVLSGATERAMQRTDENKLSVICLAAFALKCLVPSLPDFRRRHPEISLRLDTVVTFDAAASYDYDVSIRYGNGDFPGLVADKIADEFVFPVCSPALMEVEFPLRRPEDLARHTIIRTSSLVLRDDWPAWLDAAGVREIDFRDEITCDLMLPSVQAAIDGLGVVMGRTPLVEPDMREGRLVDPFAIRMSSPFGYYVTSIQDRAHLERVSVFRNWMLETFRADRGVAGGTNAARNR